eukprot:359138-Chlamydomonas_euryale.AAC.8
MTVSTTWPSTNTCGASDEQRNIGWCFVAHVTLVWRRFDSSVWLLQGWDWPNVNVNGHVYAFSLFVSELRAMHAGSAYGRPYLCRQGAIKLQCGPPIVLRTQAAGFTPFALHPLDAQPSRCSCHCCCGKAVCVAVALFRLRRTSGRRTSGRAAPMILTDEAVQLKAYVAGGAPPTLGGPHATQTSTPATHLQHWLPPLAIAITTVLSASHTKLDGSVLSAWAFQGTVPPPFVVRLRHSHLKGAKAAAAQRQHPVRRSCVDRAAIGMASTRHTPRPCSPHAAAGVTSC